MQELIDSGELKVEDRVETIKRFVKIKGAVLERDEADVFKRTVKLITGESLYALPGDYAFAEDYRKQADDFEGLGGMAMFLRERRFLGDYSVLLEFLELFKRLSKVYEIDLTYKFTPWLAAFKDDVEMLNGEILMIADTVQQASYEKHGTTYLIEVFVEDMLIDLETVKSVRGPTERYFVELEKALGGEF